MKHRDDAKNEKLGNVTATEEMTATDPLSASLKNQRRQRACLVVIFGDDVGRKFWITKDVTVVGREQSQVDVWIHSNKLSRKHCAILHKKPKYYIKDMGSTNGTVVNGSKIQQDVEISFGDKIQCGGIVFQFLSEGSLEHTYMDKLKEDAFRDGLTQVYNKKILPEVEKDVFESARRSGSEMGVIIFDIDHFKKINDTYGHLFGDEVLLGLAREIRTAVIRAEDVMIRFGGEEFVVVVPLTGKKGLMGLGERVRAHVEGLVFEHKGARVPVTVSVGLRWWDAANEGGVKNLAALIHDADQALYQSKNSGRNRVTLAKTSEEDASR